MVRMFDKVRVLFTLLVMVSLCAVSLPQQARAEAESPVVSEQAAAITTPADGEILAGMVEIQARSSGTDRVEFSIKDSTGTNTTNLGRAMKQGTENWIFSWDTGYSQDGIYDLSAKVWKTSGSIISTGSIRVTVQNQDSSTVPVAADPRDLTITAPVSGTALSGNIAVSVTGQARGVSLFALTLGEQKQFYIGEAAEGASDSWSFSWNTASFVDGEYEIYAKSAVIGGEEWMSPMVPVTIINGLVRPLTDTTLPVGLGSEYIILEESVATLVPVTDRGQEQTTLAADAEVVVLGNATITDLTLYKLNLSSVPGTEVFGGKVVVQGKGPANSTVIIKVFSEPIVASTTTDADGNWVYTLDSSLSRGDHEVYMTVSDKSSKTVGRSQLFSFLVNEAVAATDQVTDSVTTVAGSNRDLLEKYSYAVGGVIIVVLGLFLVIQRVAKKNNS